MCSTLLTLKLLEVGDFLMLAYDNTHANGEEQDSVYFGQKQPSILWMQVRKSLKLRKFIPTTIAVCGPDHIEDNLRKCVSGERLQHEAV